MHFLTRRGTRVLVVIAAAACLAYLATAVLRPSSAGADTKRFTFDLVPSPGIAANCLPDAAGTVTIERHDVNESMKQSKKTARSRDATANQQGVSKRERNAARRCMENRGCGRSSAPSVGGGRWS
jgi:hypothetical protein